MKTIYFNGGSQFHQDNRPYADVKIISGSGPTHTTKCLVDTGADYLQLPEDIGIQAGLPLHLADVQPAKNSNGDLTSFRLLRGVEVEIEGARVQVDILFGPRGSMCLAGRTALLEAFDIGMDANNWLYE